MRSLAQVQLAESSVVEGVKRNLAKTVKAGHCTAGVLFFVLRQPPVQAAALACIARYKVIAIEKGNLSMGIFVYAIAQGALDCEIEVMPARMPTLDEIRTVFD